jgi:hypothetical protein
MHYKERSSDLWAPCLNFFHCLYAYKSSTHPWLSSIPKQHKSWVQRVTPMATEVRAS